MPIDNAEAKRRHEWLESHRVLGTLVLAVWINVPMFLLFVIFVSSQLWIVIPLAVTAFVVSCFAGWLILRRYPTR